MLKPGFWRNVLETYGTRIVLIAIGLATTVVVSRTLGPTGRGFFAVATAISAIGVQFGNLGLHASNTFYVAKDRKLLPALVGNTLLISFGLGGLGILVAWTIFKVWTAAAPLQGRLLALALLWIPFGLAYMLLQNLLLGIQQVRAYNQIELATKVIGLGLIGAVIYTGKISPESMFSAALAALVLSFAWVLWRLRESLHHFPRPSISIFQQNIGLGMKAYLIAFFGYLVLRIDLLMVKYLVGAQAAGYYSISETMAENILTLPVVIGTILFPKLAEMACNEEKLRLTKKAVMVTAGCLGPLMILACVLAGPLVRIVFGQSFVPAVPAFIWLMPGSFFLGLEIVLVQYLNSLGFPRTIVFSWMLVTVVNVGVNLWAIPAYGIAGASVVSTVSYVLVFALVCLVTWRTTRAGSFASSRELPVFSA